MRKLLILSSLSSSLLLILLNTLQNLLASPSGKEFEDFVRNKEAEAIYDKDLDALHQDEQEVQMKARYLPFHHLKLSFLKQHNIANMAKLRYLLDQSWTLMHEKLLKISNFNLFPMNESNQQCFADNHCLLYPCDRQQAELCQEIFVSPHLSREENIARSELKCYKGSKCYLDPENCIFYDLSLPANFEAFTNFRGPNAKKSWHDLHSAARNIKASDYLMSRLLSGLHSNVTTHLCMKHDFDDKTQRYSEDLQLFFKRFSIASDDDDDDDDDDTNNYNKARMTYRSEYFENLVYYYMVYHSAILKYLNQPGLESELIEAFLLKDQNDIQLLDQAFATIRSLSEKDHQLDLSDLNIAQLRHDQDAINRLFKNALKVIADTVKCYKCELHGTLQVLGMKSVIEVITSDAAAGRIHLCPRQMIAFIQTYSRIVESLEYHLKIYDDFLKLEKSNKYQQDSDVNRYGNKVDQDL